MAHSDVSAMVQVADSTAAIGEPPPQGKHGPDITTGVKSKWLRKPKSRSKHRNLEQSVAASKHQHALRLTRRVPVTAGVYHISCHTTATRTVEALLSEHLMP